MINRIDLDEEAVERPFDNRMFKRLLQYILPYRRLMFWSVVSLVVGTAMQLVIPLFTKIAIDRDILTKNFAGISRDNIMVPIICPVNPKAAPRESHDPMAR